MKQLTLIFSFVLFTGCGSNEPGVTPPLITTAEATNITLTSATVVVTIESTQPDLITVRGICWAQQTNPVLNNLSAKTENGTGAGSFSAEMTGLGTNKYYVRAYTTIGGQVFYGNEVIVDIRALTPQITTTKLSNIDLNTVEVETAIAYTHTSPISEKGICWSSTATNPNVNTGTKVVDPGLSLSFTQTIGSLNPFTAYYVRGYAITGLGTFYGAVLQVVIIPPVTRGNITDIDGNKYRTVVIGTKEWMADNLKVTHYNDGATITGSGSQDQFKNEGSGACIGYGASPTNAATFGFLYNGYAVNTDKVCMTGWHVPSPTEWNQLANNLGGLETAGGRMKVGGNDWTSPNVGATNESGFNGLPGGSYCHVCLSNTGIFADQGTDGYWWSSSGGTFFYLTNDLTSMRTKGTGHINDGLSIRCVKD